MDIKARLEKAEYNLDKSLNLLFRVRNCESVKAEQIIEEINKVSQNGDINLKISKEYAKRSLNANAYSWVLQDKIAKKLGISIDKVHDKMVLEYGVLETYSIRKDCFDSAKRIFEYYKILGESEANGSIFIHIRAGVGTHNYNSKEMATFLDGVINEAIDLNIETKTPNEIAEMKSLWGSYEKQNKQIKKIRE